MKKHDSIIITVLFCLFLAIPLAATLLSPKKEFSEWENRELATISAPSGEEIFSGKFGSNFETWLTDHFFARDFWVKLKRSADSALMIKESNGVIIGDGALFDIPDERNAETVDKNISAINTLAKTGIKTSVILIPSSGSVFPEALPYAAPDFGELFAIEDIYSRLENTACVDTYPVLKGLGLENAFFKTDHHWTARGAASVYATWKNGNKDFEFESLSDSFYGTLTSRSGDTSVSPDRFERITSGDAFVSCRIFNGAKWSEYDSMYFDSYLDKKDKYSYFLGTNEPLVVLDTGRDGKTLLVFKDSFSHSFAQCLSEDYARVILVDLRYMNDIALAEINTEDVDEVLFLYGLENFTTLDKMSLVKILAKKF